METRHNCLFHKVLWSSCIGNVRDTGLIYIPLSSLCPYSRQYVDGNNQFRVRSGRRHRRKLRLLWPQPGSWRTAYPPLLPRLFLPGASFEPVALPRVCFSRLPGRAPWFTVYFSSRNVLLFDELSLTRWLILVPLQNNLYGVKTLAGEGTFHRHLGQRIKTI